MYHYFVVITEQYNGNVLRRTTYKDWIFFYEGHINEMELRSTELLIYVYNVTLKFTRELEDISATAYTG